MDQSAYLKGHSTQITCSLHHVIDDWLENVNDSVITDGCLFDISAFFYSTNYTIWSNRLEIYGITNTKLQWFLSHFKRHKQVVQFHQEHQSAMIVLVASYSGWC